MRMDMIKRRKTSKKKRNGFSSDSVLVVVLSKNIYVKTKFGSVWKFSWMTNEDIVNQFEKIFKHVVKYEPTCICVHTSSREYQPHESVVVCDWFPAHVQRKCIITNVRSNDSHLSFNVPDKITSIVIS